MTKKKKVAKRAVNHKKHPSGNAIQILFSWDPHTGWVKSLPNVELQLRYHDPDIALSLDPKHGIVSGAWKSSRRQKRAKC